MSGSDLQRIKLELEKHEKNLNDLWRKWDEDSTMKSLPKSDQPTAVRAVVSAKRLATVLIPKLKFKIDLSLRTPGDGRLRENATDEWQTINPKIASTLRDFEILETGKRPEYPTKEQKQRDKILSKNIEKCLKKSSGEFNSTPDEASSSRSQFSEDGRGDVGRKSIASNAWESLPIKAENLGTGDGSDPSVSTIKSGAVSKKLIEDVRHFKERLSKGRESQETLSGIVEDVCPDEAAAVKADIRSLAASETSGVNDFLSQEMLDEIRGFTAEEVDRRKAARNERLAKSNEIREKRIRKIEKLAQVDPVSTRPSIPSPLPIDGFLDLMETLPEEIRKSVAEETETLTDYYKKQIFLKTEPISSRHGKLVNMNHLKGERKDQRFDASDFHIRAPESAVAQEHLNMLKEQRIDNAVGRFFGTFSSHIDDGAEEPESPKS